MSSAAGKQLLLCALLATVALAASAAWTPGDIIAPSYSCKGVPQGTPCPTKMFVYQGNTFAVKTEWPQLVEAVCGPSFDGSISISAPGLGANNKQMAMACGPTKQGLLAFVNITDINAPDVTARMELPVEASIQSMQYNREGNLVVLATQVYPIVSVFTVNPASASIISQSNFTDPRISYSQDLTTDGTTLLITNETPDVLSFDLSSGTLGPKYASIPGTKCSHIIAQYDGSAIVGCDSGAEEFCAYHVAGPLSSPAGASTVLNKWCASSDYNGRAIMAMDVEREYFYVNINMKAANRGDSSVINTFKIRVSDFTVAASWSVASTWWTANVYGAVPANQQDCPVGFGQCCTSAGLPSPQGSLCKSSSNPCLLDATCNGVNITCPTQQQASNGTPCSFGSPAGLYKAVSGPMGYPAAAADISDAEAMKKGYRKCHRCYDGQCFKGKGRPHGAGSEGSEDVAAAEYTPAEPWFYCH